ncbi:unnamed protein product [Thelazia callipaeda]|uniref:TPX2_importin domain-containing protein n=1 Tax=Thelazia callipaeda TaxID=103827 RepID=A0A0N5CKW2_THECL|nr:unnamed protein product [Thelazia callipaeda]
MSDDDSFTISTVPRFASFKHAFDGDNSAIEETLGDRFFDSHGTLNSPQSEKQAEGDRFLNIMKAQVSENVFELDRLAMFRSSAAYSRISGRSAATPHRGYQRSVHPAPSINEHSNVSVPTSKIFANFKQQRSVDHKKLAKKSSAAQIPLKPNAKHDRLVDKMLKHTVSAEMKQDMKLTKKQLGSKVGAMNNGSKCASNVIRPNSGSSLAKTQKFCCGRISLNAPVAVRPLVKNDTKVVEKRNKVSIGRSSSVQRQITRTSGTLRTIFSDLKSVQNETKRVPDVIDTVKISKSDRHCNQPKRINSEPSTDKVKVAKNRNVSSSHTLAQKPSHVVTCAHEKFDTSKAPVPKNKGITEFAPCLRSRASIKVMFFVEKKNERTEVACPGKVPFIDQQDKARDTSKAAAPARPRRTKAEIDAFFRRLSQPNTSFIFLPVLHYLWDAYFPVLSILAAACAKI